MNKSDLKNGMLLETRYGVTYYIVLDKMYRLNDSEVSCLGLFSDIMKYFKEDLTYKGNSDNDIMYVYDCNGNLIWGREERLITSLINFIKNEDTETVKDFFRLYGIEFKKTKEPSTKTMKISKVGREDLEEEIRKIIDII